MSKNLKVGASSVGGIIGIIIVIGVLICGAYYFWKYKIEPRISPKNTPAEDSGTYVNVQVTATSS